jgi:hypothetical protein
MMSIRCGYGHTRLNRMKVVIHWRAVREHQRFDNLPTLERVTTLKPLPKLSVFSDEGSHSAEWPFSAYPPLAPLLRLVRRPPMYWPILTLTLLGYVSLTQLMKVWLLRKKWI